MSIVDAFFIRILLTYIVIRVGIFYIDVRLNESYFTKGKIQSRLKIIEKVNGVLHVPIYIEKEVKDEI